MAQCNLVTNLYTMSTSTVLKPSTLNPRGSSSHWKEVPKGDGGGQKPAPLWPVIVAALILLVVWFVHKNWAAIHDCFVRAM